MKKGLYTEWVEEHGGEHIEDESEDSEVEVLAENKDSFDGGSSLCSNCRPALGDRHSKWRKYLALLGCCLIMFNLAEVYLFANQLPYIASYIGCLNLKSNHSAKKYDSYCGDGTLDAEQNNAHLFKLQTKAYDSALKCGSWVYTVLVLGQAAGMSLGGHLEAATSTRKAMIIGVLMTAGAQVMCYWCMDYLWALFLLFGAVQGLGIGLAYMPCVAVTDRWFPNAQFAMWLTVSAFSGNALFWDPLQSELANAHNYKLDSDVGFMNRSYVLNHTHTMLATCGCLYAIIAAVGILLISNPDSEETLKSQMENEIVVKSSLLETEEENDFGTTNTMPNLLSSSLLDDSVNDTGLRPKEEQEIDSFLPTVEMAKTEAGVSEMVTVPLPITTVTETHELEEENVVCLEEHSANDMTLRESMRTCRFWQLAVIAFVNLFGTYWIADSWKVFAAEHLKITSDSYLSRVGAVSAFASGIGRGLFCLLYDSPWLKHDIRWTFGMQQFMFAIGFLLLPFLKLMSSRTGILFAIDISLVYGGCAAPYVFFPTIVRRTFGGKYCSQICGFLFGFEAPAMVVASLMFVAIPKHMGWVSAQLVVAAANFIGAAFIWVYRVDVQREDTLEESEPAIETPMVADSRPKFEIIKTLFRKKQAVDSVEQDDF